MVQLGIIIPDGKPTFRESKKMKSGAFMRIEIKACPWKDKVQEK
jgi:hypothetical protein